jgi:hypothetical protein
MDIDRYDARILGALQRDGRIPVVELAESIGLSPTPCARRIKAFGQARFPTRKPGLPDVIRKIIVGWAPDIEHGELSPRNPVMDPDDGLEDETGDGVGSFELNRLVEKRERIPRVEAASTEHRVPLLQPPAKLGLRLDHARIVQTVPQLRPSTNAFKGAHDVGRYAVEAPM